MSAQPVKLRDPSRRLAIETLSIRAKLSGPVWRLLSRSEWPVCAPEESPGGIAVVEVEEGDDSAVVLTGRRWRQLKAYIRAVEDRIEDLDPEGGPHDAA